MKVTNTISTQEFELQFLRAEWYKDFYDPIRNKYNNIIVNPNLDNWEENYIRKELLWKWRHPLLGRLPLNIEWHLIELSVEEFESVLTIRETGWEQTFGIGRNLKEVASAVLSNVPDLGSVRFDIIRDIKNNIGKFEFNEKLILIANNIDGPYTVVEGNHRAVAFELHKIEAKITTHIPKQFLLGVSPEMNTSPWLNFRQV